MRWFFFMLLLIFSFASDAQSFQDFIQCNNNICKCNVGKDSTLASIVLNAIQKDSIKDIKKLIVAHHGLGVYYQNYVKNYRKAIEQNQEALKLRKKNKDVLLWKSYRNLGYAHKDAGDYMLAVEHISKAFELNPELINNSNAQRHIGIAYSNIGEHEKAEQALQKSLEIGKNNNSNLANIYNDFTRIYVNTKEEDKLEQALVYADTAIKLYSPNSINIAGAYNNKGNAYKWLNENQAAIKTYEKALKIYIRREEQLLQAQTLNNIATALSGKEEYRQAIDSLNKSLLLKRHHYENTPFKYTYAANHENLAENYEALGNIEKALENYQLALQNLTDNFRNPDINTNPKTTDSLYIYNKPDLLRLLDLKAQAALKSGNIDLAYDIYRVLDYWITEFYKDLSTKASKLTWIARAHAMYGNAIEVALMKDKSEKAFEYAEKAHAVLLWQSLSQQAARSLLSENEREKMDDLNAKIRQAEQQYRNNEIVIAVLRALENEQQKLEQQFEDKYPQYKKRKYQIESTTVAQVQNMIDENTAFIEYYWTDKALHIFVITQKELTVHTIATENLAADIAELRNILITPNGDDYTECYTSLAHSIYKKLIPKPIHDNPNFERLVIVADRQIGTLPFSALATETTSMTSEKFGPNYPFLLKKYATNYLYSAGSFLQLQQKSISKTSGFAGFAPIEYPNRPSLKKAGETLDKIADTYLFSWKKATYKKEKATKQAFIDVLAENYQILLLATHAKYSKGKGEIEFYNEIMTQAEIDQLDNIQIHRLILSACQTAEGEQNFGEGILSLGWNFAYKGVPSITMTQWSVNEKTTMDIIIDYHEKLKAKTPADQALQHAQINYFDNVYTKEEYHPYYWSAIIHTGKP